MGRNCLPPGDGSHQARVYPHQHTMAAAQPTTLTGCDKQLGTTKQPGCNLGSSVAPQGTCAHVLLLHVIEDCSSTQQQYASAPRTTICRVHSTPTASTGIGSLKIHKISESKRLLLSRQHHSMYKQQAGGKPGGSAHDGVAVLLHQDTNPSKLCARVWDAVNQGQPTVHGHRQMQRNLGCLQRLHTHINRCNAAVSATRGTYKQQ